MSSSALLRTVVLVTGGGGFLGSHIVRKLVAEPDCTVYSASRNPISHPDLEETVSYEVVDIANESQTQALFQKIQPRVVIHTVSPDHLAPRSMHEQVTVKGTRNLLTQAAACASTRAFIFTSSDSSIVPNQDVMTEEQAQLYTATSDANPYGKAKGIADALVLAANGPDLRTMSLRIPIIYGDFNYKGLLPKLLNAIRRGGHKAQVGTNTRLFEVLDVHKAAEAHITAAKALLGADAVGAVSTPKVDGEAFFITDGQPTPIWDFYRRCFAAAGAPVAAEEVKVIPIAVAQTLASLMEWAYAICTLGFKKPQMRRQEMDHFERGCNWSLAKAKERLGYEPLNATEQEEAIKQMMQWGLANLPKQ